MLENVRLYKEFHVHKSSLTGLKVYMEFILNSQLGFHAFSYSRDFLEVFLGQLMSA